jgi:hypothetical protein
LGTLDAPLRERLDVIHHLKTSVWLHAGGA